MKLMTRAPAMTGIQHHAAMIPRLLLIAALGLAPSACFESNSEQPPPPPQGSSTVNIAANPDTLSIAPDTSGTVAVLSNDSPIDNIHLLSFDSTSAKQGLVEKVDSDSLRYTPEAGFSGTDTFRYTIADSHNHTAMATVTVRVDALVIDEGRAYYQLKCAICHAAGQDDNTQAFLSTDLKESQSPLQPDLTMYGGMYQLMGNFSAVDQDKIDVLKAYILHLKNTP